MLPGTLTPQSKGRLKIFTALANQNATTTEPKYMYNAHQAQNRNRNQATPPADRYSVFL